MVSEAMPACMVSEALPFLPASQDAAPSGIDPVASVEVVEDQAFPNLARVASYIVGDRLFVSFCRFYRILAPSWRSMRPPKYHDYDVRDLGLSLSGGPGDGARRDRRRVMLAC